MNIKNYKKVLAQIEAHPETWYQRMWHCNTAHCFGGHAQILSGRKPNYDTVKRDARIWLDLTSREADYLFGIHRTLEDFKRVLKNGFYSICGFDCKGYDREGFNREGFDRNGYDPKGFNRYGFYGFDRNGYDREGFNREGFDRNGYDSHGLDRNNKPRSAT